jgi:DNA-binding response OmpR family regulator
MPFTTISGHVEMVVKGITTSSSILVAIEIREVMVCYKKRATNRFPQSNKPPRLEMGADDYLRKPLGLKQLLAHITAVMRRSSHAHADAGLPVITGGPFTLDPLRHEVRRGESKVKVTPTESRLLHLLMTHAGQVLTTGVISRRMWGYDEVGNASLIKTHIHHLRQKVEPDAHSPRYILTVPGMGYTFKVPVEQ